MSAHSQPPGEAGGRQAVQRPLDAEDSEKLAALNRSKAIASSALALCVLVYAAATALEPRHVLLGFLAAFAEAAVIGGIADWYAVVALFKRPLGLPIPHTAIIPANQGRIARNLGRFIEVNFLEAAPVREKLEEVDFAALAADWLKDPRRARDLSLFVSRLVPQAIRAIGESGLRDFLNARLVEQVERLDLAPSVARLLTAFTEERRHQKLFDELIRAFGSFLRDEAALAALRDKIRRELPTLANLFRADAYLLKRIVASLGSLLDEARSNPEHPLRKDFDRFVAGFIDSLRSSPLQAERVEKLKRDLLARPELRDLADAALESLRLFVEKDAAAPDSTIREQLAQLLGDIGRQLDADEGMKRDINGFLVGALASFVESRKSAVSSFVSDQVERWDLAQLTRLMELNVGRDLQYIRFNGMIIGGLAGLLLHSCALLFQAG